MVIISGVPIFRIFTVDLDFGTIFEGGNIQQPNFTYKAQPFILKGNLFSFYSLYLYLYFYETLKTTVFPFTSCTYFVTVIKL